MSTGRTSSYYDIDDILAQEELVPCTTLFDFAHLGFLDDSNNSNNHRSKKGGNTNSKYLPQDSSIHVPLWAVEKWAHLNYVQIRLPKLFGVRARERLVAEPTQVNLRYVCFRSVSSVEDKIETAWGNSGSRCVPAV